MVTGPFEDNSFVNKNILLAIEGCGTGTFAYVVFIKILPKQIEHHQKDVCLNLLLMIVGFIITVGIQLANLLAFGGKMPLHSPFYQRV